MRRNGPASGFSGNVEESAEELYENAPCGYVSTKEDGTIVRVNETFLRLIGYSRDDLIERKKFQELLSPGGRIYHETHIAPMIWMQGHVREIAVEIVHANGKRIPSLINSNLVRLADGTPLAVRTMVFDATERRRYEEELLRQTKRAEQSEARARSLAETLQQSLIPAEPSQIPGFEVAASYLPAGESVGGDFYDVFQAKGGDWIVFVGDVSGKGVEAAKVTAVARHTLRAMAIRSADPRELLETLNQTLLSLEVDRYCTVAYSRLSIGGLTPSMTVALAGHPSPLLVAPSGVVRPLGSAGTLLGVFDEISISDETEPIEPGSLIVFYTDGVTEARSREGEFFGEERLLDILGKQLHSGAKATCDAICQTVWDFQEGNPRDDIAVLAVAYPFHNSP